MTKHEIQQRYEHSLKGRARRERYEHSEKGRSRQRRYQAKPEVKEHRRWKQRSRRTRLALMSGYY